MTMQMTTEECLAFLKEAKETIEGVRSLQEEEEKLAAREEQLEASCSAEKKRMNEAVKQTIKQRREEIHANYDREISRVREQLKKVRNRRDKAKNQGMKGRIAEETAGFLCEIKNLKSQLKNLSVQRRLPLYCRTELYYSLYFPKHPKEFLTILLLAFAVLLALPWGLYLCIPQRKLWQLVCIYMADLFVTGGIFLYIGNHSKLLYMESLRECRVLVDKIYENKRQIRRRTREIRRDRNESHYNLVRFDDDIARLEQELEDVSSQKKEALNTYESVTKNILADEIESNHAGQIERIEQEHEQTKISLEVVRRELKTKRLYISDHYGTYLGKEFLDPAKIAKLYLMIQDGLASNISEAAEKYRAGEAGQERRKK